MNRTTDLRRTVAATAGLLALGAGAACGNAQATAGPATPPSSTAPTSGTAPTGDAPSAVRLVGDDEANLHLWVSNQSFVDDPVFVEVRIDGTEVVAQPFEVEGQHNWILFTVAAPAGRHQISMVADNGTELRETFALPDEGRRYAVIDYWSYPEDGGRHFTWRIQSSPLAFA